MPTILFRLTAVLHSSGLTILSLAPYVIAGSVVGEYLKTTSWIGLLHRGFNRRPAVSVAAASVIGAVSPLCTYGTVPGFWHYTHRSGSSPLISFLAVSSMMNPQLFIMTWGGVGPEMAIARLASVLVFGVAFGLVMQGAGGVGSEPGDLTHCR